MLSHRRPGLAWLKTSLLLHLSRSITKKGSRKARRLSMELCFYNHITFPDGMSLAVWLRLPVPFIIALAIGVHGSLEFVTWIWGTIAEFHSDGQGSAGGRFNAYPPI